MADLKRETEVRGVRLRVSAGRFPCVYQRYSNRSKTALEVWQSETLPVPYKVHRVFWAGSTRVESTVELTRLLRSR